MRWRGVQRDSPSRELKCGGDRGVLRYGGSAGVNFRAPSRC